MKVVIPMAGKGSRFADVSKSNPEYLVPKPIISVRGRPMVCWALESLPFINLPYRPANTEFTVKPSDLIFVILKEHEENFSISKVLKDQFTNKITITIVNEVTRGAVETVLAAEQYINLNEDLLISDSDQFFDATPHYEAILNKTTETVGIIPVFKPQDLIPKWSYTLFNKKLTAIQVGEKDIELAKKNAYANIGAYYFSKGSVFIEEAKIMISASNLYGPEGKQEFYISPIYQKLIEKGQTVKVDIIPKLWGLGTPTDLQQFLLQYPE